MALVMATGRARIVIVGCGFGGLFTAKALRRAPADVLVIDRNNYQPSGEGDI